MGIFLTLACACAWAQGGAYAGPQILSRGGATTGERPGLTNGFTFYAGVLGSFETGIVPASVDSSGNIINLDRLIGVQGSLGAYGRRTSKRTTIGLNYDGNYRHYNANSYLDGSDHMLSLLLSRQFSRRLELFSETGAGTTSRYYAVGPASIEMFAVPNFGIFDNRAYYLQNVTGMKYQPTARLWFNASGTWFAVRRQSSSLVGLNGYGGEGTMGYRINRSRTFEATVAYNHFDYPRGFGDSDLYTAMIGMSQRLGRRWQLGIAGGVSQVHTVGLEQVAADPITSILFGNTTIIRAFDRNVKNGAGRASLRGNFRTSRVEFYYSQLPSPGNGVYLTSRQTLAGGTYSYSAIRRASISLSVTRTGISSLGQSQLGDFTYISGGAALSYKLLRSLEATLQYDARDLNINQTNGFARLSYRFGFGLNWHPSEFPISFW